MTVDISPIEAELIEELRKRFKGCMEDEMYQDDYVFLRYLRARDLDIDLAEKMLRNSVKFRNNNAIDRLVHDYVQPEFLLKYIPVHYIGNDKEGRPAVYVHFGELDPRGLLKSIKKSEIMTYLLHQFEYYLIGMKERAKKMGKPIEQWSFVFDFLNFPLSIATHRESLLFFGDLLSIYEAHYPERLHTAYIINASLYFTIGFMVVKPFLTGNTLTKIKMYGRDGYKEDIARNFPDLDKFPAFLGGNMTDPDGNPLCLNTIPLQGPIPTSYYITKKESNFITLPGVQKVTVSRMSSTKLPFTVLYTGSNLEYEFETKTKDIGFALLYKESENSEMEPEELIPKSRVDTYIASEGGVYKCEKPGVYVIEFDNSYSWIYSKEVFWKARVVSPYNQKMEAIEIINTKSV